jgi:hypothetical protein
MKRLFSNGIVTTIMGIIILGVGVYLYISQNHSEIEGAAVAAIGLIFLRSKDSLIGLNKKDNG